jgi:hypothetical protein
MNDKLYDQIFRRKSFHLFRGTGFTCLSDGDLNEIREVYETLTPLDPQIRTKIRIVPAEETTCRRGSQYCILFYSEQKPGYLRNIGYLGEQLDLYLVSRQIATLWFGIGKPDLPEDDGFAFVIMTAISKTENPSCFRKNMFKSKRKPLEEIWEGPLLDGVSEIVRFAPSACNTQPWIVRGENELSVFRYRKPGKRGIMPKDMITYYNRIDIGIFLCFLELCLEHMNIPFTRELFVDQDDDAQETLTAVYSLNRN